VDALPPGASLAGGHLSLEAFVMAPARFVERLPLAVANDALELALELTPAPVWNSNLQPDFNVRVCDSFDASSSAVLRELDESNRFVQESAESTSM
jgi:hypothetical protein